jgi:hypothetical protein
LKTRLFSDADGRSSAVEISQYGRQVVADIDNISNFLDTAASYWRPGALDAQDRLGWYAWFGTIDLRVAHLPGLEGQAVADEFVGGPEADPDEEIELDIAGGGVNLRDFDPAEYGVQALPTLGTTVHAAYDAGLANRAHRLHDLMVLLIANTCSANGAQVRDDPASVDLLVSYANSEWIIEVKSVTPGNFISRLRYGVGQVLHYDYLRSQQTHLPRRCAIGLAAMITPGGWVPQFLNAHLDFDLLSLDGDRLRVDSPSPIARQLFTG